MSINIKNAVIGLPRIGDKRELKFAIENFFKGAIDATSLAKTAKDIRVKNLERLKNEGIDFIPAGDFSYYDNLLDAQVLCNILPKHFADKLASSTTLQEKLQAYYDIARGTDEYTALPLKKWFTTNYHYIVPHYSIGEVDIKLTGNGPLDYYLEAKELGITTRPTMIGPFTLIALTKITNSTTNSLACKELVEGVINCYKELLLKAQDLGVLWFNLEEPFLVTDLSGYEREAFLKIYQEILSVTSKVKVSLQTYFGDVRDVYEEILTLTGKGNEHRLLGVGLDFIEGKFNLELLKDKPLPDDITLFAGVISGRNIWANNYALTCALLDDIYKYHKHENVIISGACSFLHVPVTKTLEDKLDTSTLRYFSFALEKITELKELKLLASTRFLGEDCGSGSESSIGCGCDSANDAENIKAHAKEIYDSNQALFKEPRIKKTNDPLKIDEEDFTRKPDFFTRQKIQEEFFKLPLLPTTTIGSFPQSAKLRSIRRAFKAGEITQEEYSGFIKEEIKECIKLQEKLGLDVLVHGEFERNDMVEYFGENLEGFLFTRFGWVQSYGTRCVKPPVIWSSIKRTKPITVETSVYAQSLTAKRVKGMLTGPVTIFNWSFPREDCAPSESIYELALAIRAEVLDLEAHGIKIIQIDEAALKEKLPLRKINWEKDYFDYAIKAFRLTHSGVAPTTQIHTHMCYSDFSQILTYIDDMDADVITFEASRSSLELLKPLTHGFKTAIGPGVYDIHSPRVPGVDEFICTIKTITSSGINLKNIWINPDCGLKTRNYPEVEEALSNMIEATKKVRASLS